MPEAAELKHTPLFDAHIKLGGQVVPFGGWAMPVRYKGGGDIAENRAVRERVGAFDVSHMVRTHLWGKHALPYMNGLVAYDLRKVEPNQARYTVMLNPEGGIIDDLLVYPFADPNHIGVISNAGNREQVLAWMREHQGNLDVAIEDVTEETGLIAVQGPLALRVLEKMTRKGYIPPETMHFEDGVLVAGKRSLISRSGYTGEDGVEIWSAAEDTEEIWSAIHHEGEEFSIRPCGLGARDSLRLESGLPLHGHEITEYTNPFEAGLGWVVSMDKGDFIGKEALLEAQARGLTRRLAGIRAISKGPGLYRGYAVLFGGEVVGSLVSGLSSPTFGVGIGTGYLTPPNLVKPGTEVEIAAGDKTIQAEVVSPRFYRRAA